MPRYPLRRQQVRSALALAAPVLASQRIPLAVRRAGVNALTRSARAPQGMRRTRVDVGGVPTVRCVPLQADPRRTLLYLHGGGYALGSARAYSGFAGRIAAAMSATAFVPEYGLAPEHRFPAGLEDAIATYRGLLEMGVDPESLVVAGDSAGGGLALALALELRDREVPLPRALGLICPWLDLALDAAGNRKDTGDPLLNPSIIRHQALEYAGRVDPADPRVSPVRADLRDLPPIVVHRSADDPLGVDVDLLSQTAAAAGVAVEVTNYPGLWHVFHLQVGALAEADGAIRAFGKALAEHSTPVLRSVTPA